MGNETVPLTMVNLTIVIPRRQNLGVLRRGSGLDDGLSKLLKD